MVVRVFVAARNVIAACARESWKELRVWGRLVQLGGRPELGEACACEEKTGTGNEVMQAASLKVLDGGNSTGKEEEVWEAAVRHACK